MAGFVDFKNKEEVKEFLANLHTEYSYQCYRERDADGCHRLADYYENINKNFEDAAKVLKFNCEENDHSESCYKLGTYHINGKGGVQADLQTAYNCFLKSCLKAGNKSINACHNVALLAQDSRMNDGKPDVLVARDYYTKACDGKFAASCFNLSTMYLEGAPGLPKDMPRALQFAEKACELGHIWGCTNASRMCKLGDGVKKDDAKAESLKKRAMDLHEKEKGAKEIAFGL